MNAHDERLRDAFLAELWPIRERSRHAEVVRLRDVIGREMLGRTTKDGPGGATNTVAPGPNRPHLSERGSAVGIMLPSDSDGNAAPPSMRAPMAWTKQVRRQAYVAVRIAAARREAGDRALAYYLRSAQAHGLTISDLCWASGLDEATVQRLTDPAVE